MTTISLNEEAAISRILDSYISSGDFNGISLLSLTVNGGMSETEVRRFFSKLVLEKKITLCFEDSGNPFIKRLPDLEIEEQLEKLQREDIKWICAYPSQDILDQHFDQNAYVDRPFTRALYVGSAQLEPRFFDMGVLERYRNDPRYHFHFEYFSGSISISSDYYESGRMMERDQVFLQSFGLAINKNKDRKVAAYLRYLHSLTPDHQTHWKGYEIPIGNYIIVPEYYVSSIIGDFPSHEPIYIGVLEEIKIINEMCVQIGKPTLFLSAFEQERPVEYGIFLRPTKTDFNLFVHTLDKILSDNINTNFFTAWPQFASETITENPDGTRTKKGTIQLLDNWLRTVIRGTEEEDIRKIIDAFKEVRKLRQKPAHKIDLNRYDAVYFDNQRDIMQKAYVAVRFIRLILSNHPSLKEIHVPDWLQEGRLRNY